MNEVTVSQDDKLLIAALRDNEFDIVALADFAPNDDTVNRCLRSLYEIVKQQRLPNCSDTALLARVLFGMVTVARQDYAAEGKQEYWPFLFDRMRHALFGDPEQSMSEVFSGQKNDELLGEWFRTALAEFNYSVPSEGKKYLAPVLFHSGIPKTSLEGTLRVIAAACASYGPAAMWLPSDIRRGLVEDCRPPLQVNVKRLLGSNLRGASQLWDWLAGVVYAWQTGGDCSQELEQLPRVLDPSEVCNELTKISQVTGAARIELPAIRFDVDTGEVRLNAPREAEWKIESRGTPVEVYWTSTYPRSSAEFRRPLPESLSVFPGDPAHGGSREFRPQPANWTGHWFHAHNGNLEDGRRIDASGLEPGRWFVLVEGTPSFPGVQPIRQVRLQWQYFQGASQWTAWEIEVPAWTVHNDMLECCVGTKTFSVPLARRPSARVEVRTPSVCRATTNDHQTLEIFPCTPSVISLIEKPLTVLLLEETSLKNVRNFRILMAIAVSANDEIPVPSLAPGVYQLRQRGASDRLLLRFAVIPQLEVNGPVIESETEHKEELARLALRFSLAAGELVVSDNDELINDDGWLIHTFPTVSPYESVEWRWSNSHSPALFFRWPVQGVRWRLLGLSSDDEIWTRDPLQVSPSKITSHEQILEIQSPTGLSPSVSGQRITSRVPANDTGECYRISLNAWKDDANRLDGVLDIKVGPKCFPVVIMNDRPTLQSIDARIDDQNMTVEWAATNNLAGCSIVVWNTADFGTPLTLFPLTPDQLENEVADVSLARLPNGDVLGVTIARKVKGMFTDSMISASSDVNPRRAVAVCVHRQRGESHGVGEKQESWPHLLFDMRVDSLFGRSRSKSWFQVHVKAMKSLGQIFPQEILEFLRFGSEVRQQGRESKLWVAAVTTLLTVLDRDPQIRKFATALDYESRERYSKVLAVYGVSEGSHYLPENADSGERVPDGFRLEHQKGIVVGENSLVFTIVFPKNGFDLQTAKSDYLGQCANDCRLTFRTAEFKFPDLSPADQDRVRQVHHEVSRGKFCPPSLADMLMNCHFEFCAEFHNGWKAINLAILCGLPDSKCRQSKRSRRK